MAGQDISASPEQFRTWVVSGNPDFDGYYYDGVKSSNHPLVNITPYVVPDGYFNFNFPIADEFNPYPTEVILDFPIRSVLPQEIEDSQLLVSDGYIYLFGSKISNNIYQATTANPNLWSIVGQLPIPLYGSSLAVVGENIFLFGGSSSYSNTGAVSTILSASISNPLNWSIVGNLPIALCYSSLGMANGELYLFGGQLNNGSASNAILTASTSSPTSWSVNANTMPYAVYGSAIAQINGSWYLYGGMTGFNSATNGIVSALVSAPTVWFLDGNLPYQTAFTQFFTTGVDGYMIGPMVGSTFNGFSDIIQCHLNEPNDFFDVPQAIPNTETFVRGVVSHSALAILQDRVWIYGGSGSSAMFACNQQVKYNCYLQGGSLSAGNNVLEYMQTTRINLPAINNAVNPFQALGVPIWRTDYSLTLPPVPPVALS